MANMDDTIGFEAQADPSQALKGLGQIEAAITQLSRAVTGFNRNNRLLPLDTAAFTRGIREAQEHLRNLERSAASLNQHMGAVGGLNHAASAQAMTQAYTAALRSIQTHAHTTRNAMGGLFPGFEQARGGTGNPQNIRAVTVRGTGPQGAIPVSQYGPWTTHAAAAASATGASGWTTGTTGHGTAGPSGTTASGTTGSGGTGTAGAGGTGAGARGATGAAGGAGAGAAGAAGAAGPHAGAAGGPTTAPMRPIGGFGQTIGGLAAMVGLGGVVNYVLQAMREQAEEYTREADLGIRLGGRGGIGAFKGVVGTAGASMGFTREEAIGTAEALGAMSRQSLNQGDLEATLRAARAMGVSGGKMGGLLGRAGQAGVFGEGEAAGFTAMLAAGAAAGGMQARQVEASEAAVDLLVDLADSMGDLSETSRQGVLGNLAFLAATGREEFRGQRGAQVLRRMGDTIAPGGGSETSESLINIALARYGTRNGKPLSEGTPLDLMLAREEKASPENLKAIGQLIQKDLGGYNETTRGTIVPIVKELLGFKTFGQAERFITSTNQLRDVGGVPFGTNAAQDKAQGQALIARNVAGMNASEGGLAREVARKDEDIRRAVGTSAFAVVKPMQDAFMSLGKVMAENITPAFKALGDQLQRVNQEFQRGGVEGVIQGRGAAVTGAMADSVFDAIAGAAARAMPLLPGSGAANFSNMAPRARQALERGQRAMANAHAHHDSPRGANYVAASRDINRVGDFTPGQLITAGMPYVLEARGGKDAPDFLRGYGQNAIALREATVDPETGAYTPTDRRVVIGHNERLFRDFKPGHRFAPGDPIGYSQASSNNPRLHGVSTGPHIHIHGERARAWRAGSNEFFRPDDRAIGLGDSRWVPGQGPQPLPGAPAAPPPPPAGTQPQQQSAVPIQYSATVNQTFVIGSNADADRLRGVVRRETQAAILAAREAAIARQT